MRIWLIGAEQAGCNAIVQLRKNANIELIVSAAVENPKAVKDGLLRKVDHVEYVTAMNINTLARRIRPDLILVDSGADKRTMSHVTGGVAFAEALYQEMMASSDYPCLVL
jgi:hypothetical protein